jgi:hypothetical protein
MTPGVELCAFSSAVWDKENTFESRTGLLFIKGKDTTNDPIIEVNGDEAQMDASPLCLV